MASRELAVESRVGHLIECMAPFFNVPLVCAFVERWQPDTNTFYMPFGEMTILLHDVANILRIPISGWPCSGQKVGKSEVAGFFGHDASTINVGGDNGGLPIYRGGGVLCEALNFHIMDTDESVDQSTTYFWHLLGNTLFADKSGDRVITGLYSLVREPGEVKEYAWGVEALAYLYRHLGMGSRMHVKGVAGCLTILQCWIYLHFSDFCPNPADRHHYSPEEPMAMKYRLRACPYTARDTDAIVAYREAIDRLRPADVIWCPYGTAPYNPHPQTCFSGVLRFLDTLEVYQPGRCLRQLGFVQSIPPPVPPPTRTFRSHSGKGYNVKYADIQFHDNVWVQWQNSCIPLNDPRFYTRASPPSSVTSDYLAWYNQHSHPFIISLTDDNQEPGADRSQLQRNMGRLIAEDWQNLNPDVSAPQAVNIMQRAYVDVAPDLGRYYAPAGPMWRYDVPAGEGPGFGGPGYGGPGFGGPGYGGTGFGGPGFGGPGYGCPGFVVKRKT